MKKVILMAAVITTLVAGAVSAQQGKAHKKEAVTQAKATVAADKANLNELKAERKVHKMSGDRVALKADRKRTFRADKKLLKDQVKKDAAVIKEKL